MKRQVRARVGFIAAIALFASLSCFVYAQVQSSTSGDIQKGKALPNQASGTFEVKLVPQGDGKPENAVPGRMSIDKQFHGDLEATSKGEMLTAGTGAKGSSGGYVAIEQVTGKLHARSGSFVLQHSGTMTRGVPQMSVTVVPDSGTGELVGLSGKMKIIIADGKHSYEFEYTLAGTP